MNASTIVCRRPGSHVARSRAERNESDGQPRRRNTWPPGRFMVPSGRSFCKRRPREQTQYKAQFVLVSELSGFGRNQLTNNELRRFNDCPVFTEVRR
jgi:hypothetical protein